jgi:hypothetical protein
MDHLAFRFLPVLFADHQSARNVMRAMHGRQAGIDTQGLTTTLLVFCLFFVCVWAVARVFIKPEGAGSLSNPKVLFRELCRAHELSRREWWFLTRLASHHQLINPSRLFLEPQWLDPAVCGESWRGHAARLRELRLRIFAGIASPVTPNTD